MVGSFSHQKLQKEDNPPACPQIRPFEYFFGIGKQVVYDKNLKAKDRPHLIRRLKEKVQNLNIEPIIKIFHNLMEKIRKADEFGLRSLN